MSLTAVCLVACSKKDEAPAKPATAQEGVSAAASPEKLTGEVPQGQGTEKPEASAAAADDGAPPEYNYKVRDNHPKTEVDLLKAIAESVRLRDIDRMRTFSSPEATADLERIYAGDRKGFWMRADVLKNDIGSGVTIGHRGDDTKLTWKVLVKFGNGVEETMTFARVDGHMKIDVF